MNTCRIFFIAAAVMLSSSLPAWAASGTRSNDLWITSSLEALMERDGEINLDMIAVSSAGGAVKLGGVVLTDKERGRVEELALEIPGVRAVQDRIRVIPALNSEFKLEKETEETLLDQPGVRIRDLRVQAQGGHVTLEGFAARKREKKLAGVLAGTVPDVAGVKNRIETLPSA